MQSLFYSNCICKMNVEEYSLHYCICKYTLKLGI